MGQLGDAAILRASSPAIDWTVMACRNCNTLEIFEQRLSIEDAFTGVEITDNDADQIEVVGDLIRHIEGNNQQRGRKLIELT